MIFYAGTGSLLLRDTDSVTLFDVQQKRFVILLQTESSLSPFIYLYIYINNVINHLEMVSVMQVCLQTVSLIWSSLSLQDLSYCQSEQGSLCGLVCWHVICCVVRKAWWVKSWTGYFQINVWTKLGYWLKRVSSVIINTFIASERLQNWSIFSLLLTYSGQWSLKEGILY